MGWCNDSRSKKYNREITFPFKYSAEQLYRRDNNYDIWVDPNIIVGHEKTVVL